MLNRRRHSALLTLTAFSALAAACSSASPPSDRSAPSAALDGLSRGPAGAAAGESKESLAVTAQKAQSQWRHALSKTPATERGCFRATQEHGEWEEVPCTKAPAGHSIPPRIQGARPSASIAPAPRASGSARPDGRAPAPDLVGGGGGDEDANVAKMIWAEGSFPSEVGGGGESDTGGNANITGANSYTLQINSNLFSSPLCNQAGCRGWEQFVYDAPAGQAFIQFWLINYSGSCPGGWNSFNNGVLNCWQNGNAVSAPVKPATSLASVSLSAKATATNDTVSVTIGGTAYKVAYPGELGLVTGWNNAEFNIFGESGGDQATFGSPTSLELQLLVDSASGTRAAPSCASGSTTAETNNLSFVGSCCAFGGDNPGIQFLESNKAGATAPACPTLGFAHDGFAPSTSLISAAGSSVPGVVEVIGGLVDSSLNAGLAPKSCTATGSATASGPNVTFNLPPQSGGTSWSQNVKCDTGGSFNESITANANPFVASPNPLLVIPGGATQTTQWGWTTSIAAYCAVPTYQILTSPGLPAGIHTTLQIDGLLRVTADASVPYGTYTLLASGYCTNQLGPFEGALTIKVVGCIPKACHAYSCEGAIADGCGGTTYCPATCPSPDVCNYGYCTAPPPPPTPRCNGVTKPITSCASPNSWICCSKWTCAKLCLVTSAEGEEETSADE